MNNAENDSILDVALSLPFNLIKKSKIFLFYIQNKKIH